MRGKGDALALLMALSGCASLGPSGMTEPTARVASFRYERLSLFGVTVVFDVEVRNPYDLDLPLAGIEFALSTGGAPFLEGEVLSPTPIPARGAATVSVPAHVAFADLARAASGGAPGALVPYAVDIALSADAPGGSHRTTFPVRHEGVLPLPASPQVTVGRIRWESLRLDLAAAIVDFRVLNPNAFAIDCARFAYELELAGRPVARGAIAGAGVIEPGGGKTLPVRVTFSPNDLGIEAFGMLQGDDAHYAVRCQLALSTAFGAWDAEFEGKGDTPLVK